MKKYILMAVAGMLALSSCSNDDNEQNAQNAPRQMTFTAGFGDGATTRATLSGKAVAFEANDVISILSANNSNCLFYTGSGGATASFNGTATADTKFYAVYPYVDGLTLDSSTGVISGVKIPSSQDAAATSACGWDPAAPVAYATTTDKSLKFKNACALLKVTNNRGFSATIAIYVHEPKMTGTFSLDTSNGSLSGGTSGYVSVSYVPDGKTIYIAIAPGSYTNFYAIWTANQSYGDKYPDDPDIPVTFEAGKIYDLGNTSDWDR